MEVSVIQYVGIYIMITASYKKLFTKFTSSSLMFVKRYKFVRYNAFLYVVKGFRKLFNSVLGVLIGGTN